MDQSRASFLTGRQPDALGLFDEAQRIQPTPQSHLTTATTRTMMKVFRDNGYNVFGTGKVLHWNERPGNGDGQGKGAAEAEAEGEAEGEGEGEAEGEAEGGAEGWSTGKVLTSWPDSIDDQQQDEGGEHGMVDDGLLLKPPPIKNPDGNGVLGWPAPPFWPDDDRFAELQQAERALAPGGATVFPDPTVGGDDSVPLRDAMFTTRAVGLLELAAVRRQASLY